MHIAPLGIGGLRSTYPRLGVSSYQRSVVWKDRQKASFVRSILLDYPTGELVFNLVSPTATPPTTPGIVTTALGPSHDVIDGQQRLTTLYELLDDPLVYPTVWERKPPTGQHDIEPAPLSELRDRFNELVQLLRPARVGYRPRNVRLPALIEKVRKDSLAELRNRRLSLPLNDGRFAPVVDAMERLISEIGRREIVVVQLQGMNTTEAEQMYHVINSSGTDLAWWELFRVDKSFAHTEYRSPAPYRTRRDREVESLSMKFTVRGVLKAHPTNFRSFWDAMYALGESYHFHFAGVDPALTHGPLPPQLRRLKVDGLGFRLVSTFLGHDIGRVGTNDLFENYDPDAVRRAIDALFDAGDVLFPSAPSHSDFAFFPKYSQLRTDAVPAYPLIGLIIAAAKLIALNQTQGRAISLTRTNTETLRELTEELFREALCTQKWSGSGDSKLREWLDSHFSRVSDKHSSPHRDPFPGRLLSGGSTYDESAWVTMLNTLAPTDARVVDKKSMMLHIWIQYLFDSVCPGTLPAHAVDFDHIVPVQLTPGSLTTHPLNHAAISSHLNRLKGRDSYAAWAPQGNDAAQYDLMTMNRMNGHIGAQPLPNLNFLANADHARIQAMISDRKSIFEFGLQQLLPYWITTGDP